MAFGLIQVVRIDEGWPDLRASAAVLVRNVHPGEKLLANSSWVDAAYLYDRGRISSPYDIYDASRVEQLHDRVDVCSFQWFVEVPGGQPWPASIRREMTRCGTFHRVYSSSQTITGLGSSLAFVTYRAPVEIWRNEPSPPTATESLAMSRKIIDADWRARLAAIALVLGMVWFLPWLVAHLDLSRAWISLPFLLATVVVCAASLVSVINRWERATPERALVLEGRSRRSP